MLNESEVEKDIIEIIKSTDYVEQNREPEMLLNTLAAKKIQVSFLFWCKDVSHVEDAKSDIFKAVSTYLRSKEIVIA